MDINPTPVPPSIQPQVNNSKSKSSRLPWLIVISSLLLIASIIAYVFLVYIPNTPSNAYRRGLQSVSYGMQYLSESDSLSLDSLQTATYNGRVTITTPELSEVFGDISSQGLESCVGQIGEGDVDNVAVVADGRFNIDDETDALLGGLFGLDVILNGKTAFRGEARLLNSDTDRDWPVFYFRVENTECLEEILEPIDDSIELSFLKDYPNAWWEINIQDMIDQGLISEAEADVFSELNDAYEEASYTQEDYEEIIGIITNSLETYVFTSDTDKMIFPMDQVLDYQADYQGTLSKRYSTTINRSNMIEMVSQLQVDLRASQVYLRTIDSLGLSDAEANDQFWMDDAEIEELVDDFIENTEIEIWVDAQTKVLRNIRFINNNPFSRDFGSYFDVNMMIEQESQIVIGAQYVSFQHSDCYLLDSSSVTSQAENCPYEVEVLDCSQPSNQENCLRGHYSGNAQYDEEGADQCWDSLVSADWDLDIWEECRQDYIESVKLWQIDSETAQPTVNLTFSFTVDLETEDFQFEFVYIDTSDLVVEVIVEATSLDELETIGPPSNPRSLIDYFQEIEEGKIETQKEYLRLLKQSLDSYLVSNNNLLPASWFEFGVVVESVVAEQIAGNYKPFVSYYALVEEDELANNGIDSDNPLYFDDYWRLNSVDEIDVHAGRVCQDFTIGRSSYVLRTYIEDEDEIDEAIEEPNIYQSPAVSSNYAIFYYSSEITCIDNMP